MDIHMFVYMYVYAYITPKKSLLLSNVKNENFFL